jgi:hypothetical protein
MRFLVALLVVFAGCVATLPDDPALTADIAAETARAVVAARREFTPAPKPTPAPAGKCETCLGTGKIGDRTGIVFDCPACKGTGKACKDVKCVK